jgi:branched-chain amino acid aminotransferase
MIMLARQLGIVVHEKSFSLYDVYGADEAFVTGTFAGLVPVREIDGRPVRHPLSTEEWSGPGPLSRSLALAYKEHCLKNAQRSLA